MAYGCIINAAVHKLKVHTSKGGAEKKETYILHATTSLFHTQSSSQRHTHCYIMCLRNTESYSRTRRKSIFTGSFYSQVPSTTQKNRNTRENPAGQSPVQHSAQHMDYERLIINQYCLSLENSAIISTVLFTGPIFALIKLLKPPLNKLLIS